MATTLELLRNEIFHPNNQDIPLGVLRESVDELITRLETEMSNGNGGSGSESGALLGVRVAATTDIDVITGGLLTVAGVDLNDGDRVLVWLQTDITENGVYLARTGAWDRAPDALTYDDMKLKTVNVGYDGSVQYNSIFTEIGSEAPAAAKFEPISDHSDWGSADAPHADDVSIQLALNRSIVTALTSEPSDADVTANGGYPMAWYDNTASAAKLHFKAKDSGGGFVTATVNLT